MSKDLRYKRNWSFEQMADVHFLGGRREQLFCSTNNKGQIDCIKFGEKYITPAEFADYGITEVHFMTPAKLEVKQSTELLVKTYIQLGLSISQGDTMAKMEVRSQIADEIYKRGLNLHDEMAKYS